MPLTVLTNRRVLNRILNTKIKGYTALYNMLFPPQVRRNLYEEFAQVDVIQGSTGMAPFVKVGTKAQIMSSDNGTSYIIQTPFINIKRPMTYSNRLAARMVGGNVMVSDPKALIKIIREQIGMDMEKLNELVDNRFEWMAAQMLTGTLTYSGDGDAFTIATGKPAGNTFQAAALWTTTCRPFEDIRTVKGVVSGYRGPMPTVAIGGAGAASTLRALVEAGTLKLETNNGVDKGRADLRSNIEANGMIFLGRFAEVDFYEYLGTYVDDSSGAATALIRDEYFEFFSQAPQAVSTREMMFGLIPDLKAIMEGNAVTDRYVTAKAPDEDQGTYESILKTRPFPWIYRPEWMVSLKVK